MVHLPALLSLGYGESRSKARSGIAKGSVYVNGVCLGVGECDMPRADLANAVVRWGKRPTLTVGADARSFRRERSTPASLMP